MPIQADELLHLPICAGMSTKDAQALIGAGRETTLRGGQFLCRSGDKSTELFLVLEGTLDVILGQQASSETTIATVTSGQIAGELEMLTGALRVASLRSQHDTRLLVIPAERFMALLNEGQAGASRLLLGISRALARRLATANQHVLSKIKQTAPAPVEEIEEVEAVEANPQLEDEDQALLDKLWS